MFLFHMHFTTIYFSCKLRVAISRFNRSKYRIASMSSSCMCCAHCCGVRSVRSSVVPYFNCPARLRSWNEWITDATTVSSTA